MSEAPLVFETRIQPRNHAVLVKPFRVSNMYKGQIHLPDRSADASNNGIVVRVGSKVRSVHVGEWVLYNWRQGITVDDDFIVLEERALIAVLAEPREVLIPIGIFPCAVDACHTCEMLIKGLFETGLAKIALIDPIDWKDMKKFEALINIHDDSIWNRMIGYAEAHGIRTYIGQQSTAKLVSTIIADLRPRGEE